MIFGWTKKYLLERDLNLRDPDLPAGALPTELCSPIVDGRLPTLFGVPVRSHSIFNCRTARDHTQVYDTTWTERCFEEGCDFLFQISSNKPQGKLAG